MISTGAMKKEGGNSLPVPELGISSDVNLEGLKDSAMPRATKAISGRDRRDPIVLAVVHPRSVVASEDLAEHR